VLAGLQQLERNLAELLQTRMVAACVEGYVSGGVAAGDLVTCSVHGLAFKLCSSSYRVKEQDFPHFD